MSVPSTQMATTTAPHAPPPRIIVRTHEEMIRIRRLKKNLEKYPDVSQYAHDARCLNPKSKAPPPTEKTTRDNISLGKNLGTTLFHRECLMKQLGVFGMVANSEERQRFYKNWVRFTKEALQKEEERVSEEHRKLRIRLMVERRRIRKRLCVRPKNSPTLEEMLGEIQDEQEEAATAYVRECKKLSKHRVKMENEMKRIKDLLAEMSQYPQGDLPKIWGKGYDQASKNIGRRTTPEESDEISDLV